METTVLKVGGMSCGGCVKSVTNVLTALPGVAKAEVLGEEPHEILVPGEEPEPDETDGAAAESRDDEGLEAADAGDDEA